MSLIFLYFVKYKNKKVEKKYPKIEKEAIKKNSKIPNTKGIRDT